MTRPEPGRRRRVPAVLAAVLAGGVVTAVVGYALVVRPRPAADRVTAPPTDVATVIRGTVTERVQVSGTLGFAGAYRVVHQGPPGILTSVATPGRTVTAGEPLYAVADLPARLLIGTVPAYRDLGSGTSPGPDVRQLEENLVALGLDPRREVTVDERFTAATAASVRRWQATWGWPPVRRSGRLPLGQVVFHPGPLRVSRVPAEVGTTVGPDVPVLTGTSTTRVVTAQVGADRQRLVHVSDRVLVTVPGLAPLTGTVTAVGQLAPGPAADGDRPGPPAAPVTVSVDLPPGSPDLDQAPVQVAITTASRADVLLVPVRALLARPGGGYQVRLAAGGFVEVRPGLFDDATGTVEVSGPGLVVGQQVQVPAS